MTRKTTTHGVPGAMTVKNIRQGQARTDGWINALTGIGQATRDKSLGTTFVADMLTRRQLEEVWRGDDMAARIIETIPAEMLREGVSICIQADKAQGDSREMSEAVESRLEELGFHDTFKEAMCYERAFGGSGILLGVDDGQKDMRVPLDLSKIKSMEWMTALAAHELNPVKYYDNPMGAKFGEPELYRLQPDCATSSGVSTVVDVHESRLILFKGIQVSRKITRENKGWGDSVLVRCNRVLSNFHQTWGAAAILVQDFAGAVMKVKDLADLIATDQDDVVINRVKAMEMSRSVARVTIIDAEEEYERKATPLAGLPDMLEKFCTRLAASSDMPVTLLMGQPPQGLGATGASDIRFFYDRVKARQRVVLLPRVRRLARIVMLTKGGPTNGKEPKNWTVKANPLWQLDEVQQSAIRYQQAQTDGIYIDKAVISPEECAASRFGGDEGSTETTIDFKGREEITAPALEIAKVAAGAAGMRGGF